MADGTDRDAVAVEAHPGVAAIDAALWDACAAPEATVGGRPRDPFTTHRFLSALELSGSVGGRTGWTPRPLVARAGDGRLLGATPLYVKGHSQGEYVFDHAWAHAWERAGGEYYPKLQIAAPFTPVTGRRFLAHPDADPELAQSALLQGAIELARRSGIATLHATFVTEAEQARGEALGLLPRRDQQFHWESRGYAGFDDFLADLSSRKRKQIRKERETAHACGARIRRLTGDDLRPEHWDAFWRFYQDTGSRKWGRPYLTRAFFDHVQQTMRDDALLVLAERDGRPIAGALNFIGRDALFGRYWGCVEDWPCLHFELCYHQAVEAALELGLSRVEAGAQGAHKLARGYLPRATYSLHWIGDPGFRRAVADYLEREREAVDEEIELMLEHGPFRKGG
jgi:predicted N-acyltransferase